MATRLKEEHQLPNYIETPIIPDLLYSNLSDYFVFSIVNHYCILNGYFEMSNVWLAELFGVTPDFISKSITRLCNKDNDLLKREFHNNLKAKRRIFINKDKLEKKQKSITIATKEISNIPLFTILMVEKKMSMQDHIYLAALIKCKRTNLNSKNSFDRLYHEITKNRFIKKGKYFGEQCLQRLLSTGFLSEIGNTFKLTDFGLNILKDKVNFIINEKDTISKGHRILERKTNKRIS